MSQVIRGGRPYVMRITVPAAGGHWALPQNSSELIFRPQSGTARIYWSKEDYFNDPDGKSPTGVYSTLNGDTTFGELRLRAAVGDIWLRGSGAEVEVIIISQAT